MANNQIGNQRSIDFQNYLQEFAAQHPNMSGQFLVQKAQQAFNADAVDEKNHDRYAADKENLIRMQTGKDAKGNYIQEWVRVRQALAQAQGTDRQRIIDGIDAKYGRGFHRYLTGGRP
jgi:outer membrane biogenesis lipoprotein LolB